VVVNVGTCHKLVNPIKGLQHAGKIVQAWWTDNMPGDEFPVLSGYIEIGFNHGGAR